MEEDVMRLDKEISANTREESRLPLTQEENVDYNEDGGDRDSSDEDSTTVIF